MGAEPALPDFDTLWDYDDPVRTERRFQALLPQAHAAGDRAYLLQLLTQIARAQALQRHFEEAHRTLDEVQANLRDDRDTAQARTQIRYLLERGRVYNSSRQPQEARPLFREAWETAIAHGEDGYAVDAAHMLAIVAEGDEQMGWNLCALELAERSDDPRARRWLGSLYNNIGWSHHGAGRFAEALDSFEKALRQREEQGGVGEIRIARWCVARTLRSLGRIDEALTMQRELLAELNAGSKSDGYVDEELGECLLALGRVDEARPHLVRAYAALSRNPWLVESEPARLARLRELAG